MTVDFDIMTKIQKVVNTELYEALCRYIEYRENCESIAAYREGLEAGRAEGE